MHKDLTKGMVGGGVPSAFIHSEGPNVVLDSVVGCWTWGSNFSRFVICSECTTIIFTNIII